MPAVCPSCKSKEWDPDAPVDYDDADKAAVLERYGSGEGCIEIASDLEMALFDVIGIVREATGDDEPYL